jgi:iron(III) transport system permease protein
MVFVMALFTAPYAYLFTVGSFQKIDATLEEAARIAGASTFQTMRRISVPLATPAILSAALFIFVLACGVLEVPLAIGGPGRISTLSVDILNAMNYPPNLNHSATLASVVLAITIAGVYFQRRVILKRSYVTVTGKATAPRLVDLGRWRWLTFGLNLLYVLLALVFPLSILLLVSISRVWGGSFDPSVVTLENYEFVLFGYEETARGIQNSLFLGVLTGLLGATLAVILSYIVYRTRWPGRGLIDFIAMVPIAVPGVALGIALLVAWISTPVYGTLWILLIAYVTRWLPTAQKNVSSVLLAISPELDECTRVCGASWLTTMRRVMIPLLQPGIVAAFLLMFIISIRELSASLLLYKPGTEVMSVALWLAINRDAPTVAAVSMVQSLILLTATVLFFRTAGRTAQF